MARCPLEAQEEGITKDDLSIPLGEIQEGGLLDVEVGTCRMPVGEWTSRIVVDDLELELGIATRQPSLLQPSRHLQVLRLEIGGEIDAR